MSIDIGREIAALVARKMRFLARHRERYVRAWIAATGMRPEDCMLVEEQLPMDTSGAIRMNVYIVPRRGGMRGLGNSEVAIPDRGNPFPEGARHDAPLETPTNRETESKDPGADR